jgi:hypothetical protein
MALFVEFKPILGEIAKYLRIIANKHSHVPPTSGTGATIAAGFSTVKIVKTIASGTVTITLPSGSTYVLTRDGEEFFVENGPFGAFSIVGASGGTWKWYAY